MKGLVKAGMRWRRAGATALLAAGWLVGGCVGAGAQGTDPAPTAEADKGKVVFSADRVGQAAASDADVFPKVPVKDEERAAVVIAADDLDLHLTPADAREEAHAILTLRNVSGAAMSRIPLQISSTLRWMSVAMLDKKLRPVAFTQSPIATDADHTGYAQEAVLTPEHPLAAGASMTVSVFYAGQVQRSTERLELVGTPAEKAAETDWDAITPTTDEGATSLRGFGQVLWYPVAAPKAALGDGNRLFNLVERQRLLNATSTMRLRLTVVYAGDPPEGVIFNSRLKPLERTPDDSNQVIDETHGIATAEFAMAAIGFRTPSLFLTAQREVKTGAAGVSVITPVPEAAEPYVAAVGSLQPLFEEWIGPAPLTPLLLLEHGGTPFEDGPFIAAHLSAAAEPEAIAPELVRGMTHSYLSDAGAAGLWLDEGVPELMALLWTERKSGRAAAITQLQQDALAIALAEPDLVEHPELTGTPLTQATTDVMLRLKAAAVLWQLRELVGDDTFKRALAAFRHSLTVNRAAAEEANGFEKVVEKTAGVDLQWFFDDWVYHDRGLPDLTVTSVNPRAILAKGGRGGGYLVAVEVRNDGAAAADVPVTVRSGSLSATERLRVAGRSTGSVRIVFEGTPETLQVNDGSVAETRTSVHTMAIKVTAAP